MSSSCFSSSKSALGVRHGTRCIISISFGHRKVKRFRRSYKHEHKSERTWSYRSTRRSCNLSKMMQCYMMSAESARMLAEQMLRWCGSKYWKMMSFENTEKCCAPLMGLRWALLPKRTRAVDHDSYVGKLPRPEVTTTGMLVHLQAVAYEFVSDLANGWIRGICGV